MKIDNVQAALNEFGKLVIDRAKSNLKKGGKYGSHNTSNKLTNSLRFETKEMPRSISFDFFAEDYWKFLDKGVKGKISSAKAPNSPYKFGSGKGKKGGLTEGIQRWVKARKFQFKDKKGKFMSYDSTAWLITRSIYAKGIRPTLFFTKPFEAAYKRLPQELVNDLKIDLEKIFNYSIKQPK